MSEIMYYCVVCGELFEASFSPEGYPKVVCEKESCHVSWMDWLRYKAKGVTIHCVSCGDNFPVNFRRFGPPTIACRKCGSHLKDDRKYARCLAHRVLAPPFGYRISGEPVPADDSAAVKGFMLNLFTNATPEIRKKILQSSHRRMISELRKNGFTTPLRGG